MLLLDQLGVVQPTNISNRENTFHSLFKEGHRVVQCLRGRVHDLRLRESSLTRGTVLCP